MTKQIQIGPSRSVPGYYATIHYGRSDMEKVRMVTSASEWLRLFGHSLGAPPREMWPKYGRWNRQQHEPFTLTDAQLRDWRAGR